jgi:hypothetical protein
MVFFQLVYVYVEQFIVFQNEMNFFFKKMTLNKQHVCQICVSEFSICEKRLACGQMSELLSKVCIF